ncbi:MAG: DNA-binding response regulator [Patescibacteria group bacterium]|jgi:DNA-binding response OmpR family regulator|nr:DNA-binding response regulator [Patescibacteria group bacterium]
MKRILVVEDEQMLAKIIDIKLKEENFEVIHAYDGEQAYEALSGPEIPDLVLLDLLLPKMGGFQVLEKLKEEGKTIPKVVIFSNFAQRTDIERAYSLGAIDYIVKAAFSPAEILSKIKKIFENESSQPDGSKGPGYAAFDSIQDVMPMSEVLRPGEPNNNS